MNSFLASLMLLGLPTVSHPLLEPNTLKSLANSQLTYIRENFEFRKRVRFTVVTRHTHNPIYFVNNPKLGCIVAINEWETSQRIWSLFNPNEFDTKLNQAIVINHEIGHCVRHTLDIAQQEEFKNLVSTSYNKRISDAFAVELFSDLFAIRVTPEQNRQKALDALAYMRLKFDKTFGETSTHSTGEILLKEKVNPVLINWVEQVVPLKKPVFRKVPLISDDSYTQYDVLSKKD